MAPAALETLPGPATPLLATFAVMELVKSAPWSGFRPTLAHFRTGTRELVVLEDHRQGLRMGIVLHAGGETGAAGPGFWSLPFQALRAPGG